MESKDNGAFHNERSTDQRENGNSVYSNGYGALKVQDLLKTSRRNNKLMPDAPTDEKQEVIGTNHPRVQKEGLGYARENQAFHSDQDIDAMNSRRNYRTESPGAISRGPPRERNNDYRGHRRDGEKGPKDFSQNYNDSGFSRNFSRDRGYNDYSRGRGNQRYERRSYRDYAPDEVQDSHHSYRSYNGMVNARERERSSDYQFDRNGPSKQRSTNTSEYTNDRHISRQGLAPRSYSRQNQSKKVDLLNVTPLNEIKRDISLWDIKPKGYEQVQASRAKLSGLFSLPSAQSDRSKPVPPVPTEKPEMADVLFDTASLSPTLSTLSKKLVVTNLNGIESELIINYLNGYITQLSSCNVNKPIVGFTVVDDKSKIILELDSSQSTTLIYGMNGMNIEDLNLKLDLSRPEAYVVGNTEEETSSNEEVSDVVIDSKDKLALANIPIGTERSTLINYLSKFGTLTGLELPRSKESGESQSFAFCQFKNMDQSSVIESIESSKNDQFDLRCFPACNGLHQEYEVKFQNLEKATRGENFLTTKETKVVQLLNIFEPVISEFEEFGRSIGNFDRVFIPNAAKQADDWNCEKLYMVFHHVDSARKAIDQLAGKLYNDRTVLATYTNEKDFANGIY
ncbi:BA75_01803T0 [Komagataella pastoris]|uniref:BA75_01803T0 n=1 Tax=Komagataella pastoris TaxID=4922 RepID=A0A1B2J6S6_PICPA|nr:BA75_01803T0 [Komagataella pastoris]